MLRSPNRLSPVDFEFGGTPSARSLARTRLLAIALAIAFALPGVSLAEPGDTANPKVILVQMATCCRESACPHIESLLADELEATALDFAVVDGASADTANAAGELAARLGGGRGVVLRVQRANDGTCDLTTAALSDSGGEVLVRTTHLSSSDAPDAAVNAAIESTEAVFALLLELKLVAQDALGRVPPRTDDPLAVAPTAREAIPPPARGRTDAGEEKVEKTDETSPPPPRTHLRRLGIGVGGAFIWSPGGIDPMGAVRLSFDARPADWVTLRLDAWITLLGRDLESGGERATFDAAVFRLSAFYEFLRRGWFRPALGLGGGGAVAWSRGVAGEGVEKEWEVGLGGYAGGAGRIAALLGEWFRAELGLAAGVVLPETTVRFGGSSVASFGMPVLDAYIELEIGFL